MRLLIPTAGSHGDINPFIALARAALARGHEPVVLANPYFRSQIEEAGVAFEPMGELFDLREVGERFPDVMHPRKGGSVVLNELLIPAARDTYNRILELAPTLKPDAVLHHFVCLGAPWACEKLSIPCYSAVLAPMNWMSRGDTLTPMSWSPLDPPRALSWVLRSLLVPLMGRMLDRPINRVRRELGLPKLPNLLFGAMRGGDRSLGLWSPHFRGPCSGDPPAGRICGFPWHDRHGEAEDRFADVRKFVEEGDPPILFCLGTAAVHVAGDFYEHAAEACRLLSRRGLLLVGPSRAGPANLPPGVGAFPYAPFSWVMPRCAVNVHHAGIGSTAQALRAGRPTVTIPHAHDQFDNAARLMRLGVSVTVPRPRVTGRRLADAISSTLTAEAGSRAAEMGRKIAGEDGAVRAIELIETWMKSGQRPAAA